MKKLMGLVCAGIMTLALSLPVYAETAANTTTAAVDPSLATMTFDTAASFNMWSAYSLNNAVKTTVLTPEVELEKTNTYASMKISASNVLEDDGLIGFAVNAESFGLTEFDGCSFSVSLALPVELASNTDFAIFADGGFWSQQSIGSSSGTWNYYNLEVPVNSHANMFGFVLPVNAETSGALLYVDNLCVYDPDGNQIANIGDTYTSPVIEQTSETQQRATSVLFVVITVIAVLALVGGAVYLFYLFIKRFR